MLTQEREKLLPVSELWRALDEAGIAKYTYGRRWLKMQEDRGRIQYPNRDHHERRKFTAAQIEEIVDAFRPGGSRHWTWPGA